MSLMILAAMFMAQAPAAAEPAIAVAAPAAAAPAAKKQKPAQVCEYIEVTGSRSKRRVCRDASGYLDLGPGVSSSAFGKERSTQPNIATGGPGAAN